MKIRSTRLGGFVLRMGPSGSCMLGAALAVVLNGCSSNDTGPASPSAMLAPSPTSPEGMPAPSPSAPNQVSAPAPESSSSSEGQAVPDLLPMSDPSADPGAPAAAEPAPRPPAELPSSEPAVSGPIDVTVSVNVAERFQTLVGFGASQVYYVDWVVLNPNADELYDVLFRDLGLDVLRIGNWYQARDIADPQIQNTIELVQGAQQALERVPSILMTSWSPPAELKSNGQLGGGGTLLQRDGGYVYAEFGDWWREAIDAYRASGVPIDYVGMQNEPDFTADYDSGRFSPTEGQFAGYGQALAAVRERLSTLEAPPALIGPEVIGLNVGNIASYLDNLDPNDLDAVAHHLYSGGNPNVPDSYNAGMSQLPAVAAGKPIIMSEFAPEAQGPQFFETAWLIHNALTVEGVSAYLYWALGWRNREGAQPVDPGLVTLEDPRPGAPPFSTSKGYTVNPTYYAVKHYSRWLDAGFQRVSASSSAEGLRASAYISPENDRVTIVLLNTDAQTHTVSLEPAGFVVGGSSAFRTAGSSELTAALGALPMPHAVTLPSRSLVTVVWEGSVGD